MNAADKVKALIADGWSKGSPPLGVWITGRNVNSETELPVKGRKTPEGGTIFEGVGGRFFVFQVWRALDP